MLKVGVPRFTRVPQLLVYNPKFISEGFIICLYFPFLSLFTSSASLWTLRVL